ncbi:MAG: hypothetical protein Q9M09_05100, partial [Mariprofundaceae bacterium]|nr:hypothetical protein [Mariprofundaceae bacterium]
MRRNIFATARQKVMHVDGSGHTIMLMITNALFAHADAQGEAHYSLHPSLSIEPKAYHQQWFNCTPRLPLEVIAWLHDCSPISYLAPQVMSEHQAQQCWLAA